MNELKALVFDLDGVLTDTAELHYFAWKRLADELGLAFDREQNEALKGISRLGSLEIILQNNQKCDVYTRSEKEILANRKNKYYKELIETLTQKDVLPGISYLLDTEEVGEYLDLNKVIRTIPLGFDATAIIGKIFIVTGTGKYFKNVDADPETNLGIVRIASDGQTAELLWGYKDGGKFTSEFPAHLMSHMARLSVDPENRVVMHCHPTYTLAMNYVHELDEKKFTHSLWEMCTECIVVFPDGVGVLPWMLCGTNSIGEATAEKMKEFRLVVWGMHGIYGAGKTMDETFGLIRCTYDPAGSRCRAPYR